MGYVVIKKDQYGRKTEMSVRQYFDLPTRQIWAALATPAILIGVPTLVLIGSLIATCWATALNVHDVHDTIWGWLSTKDHGKNTVNDHPWVLWIAIVVSSYFLYQGIEVLHGVYSLFKDALLSPKRA